jgi:nicotinamide mononucleotide transporter
MSTIAINAPRTTGASKNVLEGIGLGVILTTLSYAIGLNFGWLASVSYLEAFAVFTSYVCTYLCVRERRINYPIGAISNAAYSLLFYSFGLMGSSIVTGYLTLSLAYGWFRWKRDEETKPVTFVDWKLWPAYLIATGLAFAGGYGIYQLTDAKLVWTDLVVMAGSILAQFLLDNKKMENWMVWIVVNVFAIYTYINAGLSLVAFQYVFFLLNAFYGLYVWNNSRKGQVDIPKDDEPNFILRITVPEADGPNFSNVDPPRGYENVRLTLPKA